MFGAIISTVVLVYAVLAIAMVVVVPVIAIRRMRRELKGQSPAEAVPGIEAPDPTPEDREEQRQLARVRLRTTAEAAVRSHDQVLEEWVAHLQDEQIEPSPLHGAHPGTYDTVDPAVQKQLLDALDTAQQDRIDPTNRNLDHYAVGLYATRVRELEAAWSAYRRDACD